MAEYYFIVNRKSRTGKAEKIWNTVSEELKKQKIDYEAFTTEYKGHATELARKITSGEDALVKLVVVGGDGTSNEVLNGITDFGKVQIGFIPTGSGNDLGRGLKITGDSVQQLHRILNATTTFLMDLGTVSWNNGKERRIFAISSGLGLDADVCKQALTSKMKKALNVIGLGGLTYVLLTIKTLFGMQTARAKFVKDDQTVLEMDKLICAVAMNLRYEGGGVPMAPQAVCTDGELSFCCISGIPKWKAFLSLPRLVAAKHESIKGFTILNCKTMDIEIEKKMIVHADGEYCGDRERLHFACLPKALNVRM